MLSKKKIYPYLLLIACAGIIAITFGLVNIQGLFFDSISSDLGIGKGKTAFYVTLIHISGAVFAPVGVRLRKSFSVRQILLVDGLLVIGALLLIPNATAIWQVYICAFIVGTGQGIYGNTMVVELINRWFEKANTAIGIAMCASGIFGSLFSPIFVNRIVKFGWRKAYYLFAVIVAVVLIYSFLVIEDKPQKQIKEIDKKEDINVMSIDTVFVATLYLFASSMTAIGGYLLSFSVNIGLSMNQGATLSSAINIGNLVLKLIFGVLCDRIGGYKSALIAFGLITLGSLMLVLCPANMYVLLVTGAVLLGASFTGSNVLTSSICGELFGKDNVSAYYAAITSFSFVSAFSSTIIGFVYDLTGSYKYSILGFEILIGVSLILIKTVYNKRKKHI